jgi:hypothetical protein
LASGSVIQRLEDSHLDTTIAEAASYPRFQVHEQRFYVKTGQRGAALTTTQPCLVNGSLVATVSNPYAIPFRLTVDTCDYRREHTE